MLLVFLIMPAAGISNVTDGGGSVALLCRLAGAIETLGLRVVMPALEFLRLFIAEAGADGPEIKGVLLSIDFDLVCAI